MTRRELHDRMRVIQRLKERFVDAIHTESVALQEAALSPLLDAIRSGASLDDVLSMLDSFALPSRHTDRLTVILRAGVERTSHAKNALYIDSGVLQKPIHAVVSSINFPRLQRITNEMIKAKVVAIIRDDRPIGDLYAALRSSNFTAHHAATLTNTSLSQSFQSHTHSIASSAGLDLYEYFGPPAERLFCLSLLGRKFSRQDILGLDNGQGLPVLTSAGGFNCRHDWLLLPAITK